MSVSPSFPSGAPHKSSFYLPSDGQRNNSQTGTLAMASREPPQSSSLRPFAAALERDRSSGLILDTDKIRSPILLDVAQKYCIYFRRTPHAMVFSEISKQVLFWAELSGKIFCSPVATSLRGLKSVLFFRPPSLLLDSRGRIPPPAVSPFNSALNAFLWSGSVRRVVLQTLSCKN